MSTKCKSRIHKTCVHHVMAYAVETRAKNTTTKILLRTTERRTLRSIVAYIVLDHKRSEEKNVISRMLLDGQPLTKTQDGVPPHEVEEEKFCKRNISFSNTENVSDLCSCRIYFFVRFQEIRMIFVYSIQ